MKLILKWKMFLICFKYAYSSAKMQMTFHGEVITQINKSKSPWPIDDDELNANCRRHMTGGRALPINCWECSAEFREDERDDQPVEEHEDTENE